MMILHDVKQGTDEWLYLRAKIPTASEFDNLVTPEFKPRTGQTPATYMHKKIAEKCMGIPLGSGGTFSMDQGSMLETEAIPWYEFTFDVKIQRVGFCTTDDGRIGCSPDGLIGDDGGIEVKCPEPHTHVRYLLDGGVPKEYLAQVHGSMFVTGRPWWIFLSYNRQFPAHIVTVKRDPTIQGALRGALNNFLRDFDEGFAYIDKLKKAARGEG